MKKIGMLAGLAQMFGTMTHMGGLFSVPTRKDRLQESGSLKYVESGSLKYVGMDPYPTSTKWHTWDEVNFDDINVAMYTVDTYYFRAMLKSSSEPMPAIPYSQLSKVDKHPEWYTLSGTEVKELLNRYWLEKKQAGRNTVILDMFRGDLSTIIVYRVAVDEFIIMNNEHFIFNKADLRQSVKPLISKR
jgi:hypothetical protein